MTIGLVFGYVGAECLHSDHVPDGMTSLVRQSKRSALLCGQVRTET